MTDDELPPNAKILGLSLPQVRILYLVIHWYNNLPVSIDGEEHRLATHPEPSMADLFKPTSKSYDVAHQAAHKKLLERGLLQEDWIWRRKCDWLPTEQGLQVIRSIFGHVGEPLRPEWASEDEDGPIYSDPNELLLHRKGVEALAHFLKQLSWALRISYYPGSPTGNETGDLRMKTPDRISDWEVEVLCSSNNTEQWIEKWMTYSNRYNTTVWIFDDRSTMCRLLNSVHHAEEVNYELDGGPFSEPYDNWSKQAVNEKLRRSRDPNRRTDDAGWLVHTITGVLDADVEQLTEWVEDFYEQRAGANLERVREELSTIQYTEEPR